MNEIIAAAARKHQVNPAFVKSIIAAESGFSEAAVSPKGAVGLMQLMPETAREFGADPAIPEQNIDAGPGAVERYGGVPPFRETRIYVARVLRFYQKYEPAYALVSLRGAGNRVHKALG